MDTGIAADKWLLAQLKEGSRTAFDALYERYWEQVYGAAYKRLQDAGFAKDITQDIFLQLWLRRGELEIDNLPAYLFTAVRNNVFKRMEKEKRYTPIPELMSLPDAPSNAADGTILRKEFMKVYEALIKTLTPSQQEIFRMRYQQDMTTAQIAEQLNISRKTVQNQLGKSIIHLRESLLVALVFLLQQRP